MAGQLAGGAGRSGGGAGRCGGDCLAERRGERRGGERAGAEDRRRRHRAVDDGRFDSPSARAGVEDQVDPRAEALEDMRCRRRREAERTVRARSCQRFTEAGDQFAGDRLVGASQRHRWPAGGDAVGDVRCLRDDDRHRAGPAGPGDPFGGVGPLRGQRPRHRDAIDMDDERIGRRPPLGEKNPLHGALRQRQGGEPVDRLGRDRHQPPRAEHRRGPVERLVGGGRGRGQSGGPVDREGVGEGVVHRHGSAPRRWLMLRGRAVRSPPVVESSRRRVNRRPCRAQWGFAVSAGHARGLRCKPRSGNG